MSVNWQDSGRGQLYTIKMQQMILLIKKGTGSWRSRSWRNFRHWPPYFWTDWREPRQAVGRVYSQDLPRTKHMWQLPH